MKRRLLLANWVYAFIFASPVLAAEGGSPATPGKLDPQVEKILDRQEARGKDLKDIKCKLEYIKEDEVLKDKQILKGGLLFKEAEPNPHFLIEFTEEIQENVVRQKKQWFVFDGRWYIEARESTQTVLKHEVLRAGEKKNVFKLGEGPFPVPFGQKKKDIVEQFTIKLIAPTPKDPADTDHLECTPRPGTELFKRYGTVHFWISKKQDLPVKLTTRDKEEDRSITAIFADLEVNKGIPGSTVQLPPLPGYKESLDPLPLSADTIDKGIGR